MPSRSKETNEEKCVNIMLNLYITKLDGYWLFCRLQLVSISYNLINVTILLPFRTYGTKNIHFWHEQHFCAFSTAEG